MCKFSSTCRLDCVDALQCPAVTAVFGPVKVYSAKSAAGKAGRGASGWWSKSDGKRPVARLNEQGQKLCSHEGCNELRVAGWHMCIAHRREYQRDYYAQNKSVMLARAKAHYQANRK